MTKNRLEAFSDGVIAIIITIMVLELKPPAGPTVADMRAVTPGLLTYLLSFVLLGIYWNNHHHMLHACSRVNGRILWANLHLLFWLSLVPYATGFMEEQHFATLPTASYGVVMLLSAVAYTWLQHEIVTAHGPDSRLAAALGGDFKGKASLLSYVAAIGLAFISPWISIGLYVTVALIWLVPDRRIERTLEV